MKRLKTAEAVLMLAMAAATPALAQETTAAAGGTSMSDVPPAAPVTANTERFFVDTQVSDVFVDGDVTVALLEQSPLSSCPSNEYVYERSRPKWLYETGRLMVAQKQAAVIRVSVTCKDGNQVVNAVQFLSPPPGAVAQAMPLRSQTVQQRQRAQPVSMRPLPVPGGATYAGQSREEMARTIPLP
ncbi:hypothetical protein [Acuticoccus mangrovi]|uniref:Uncharacterized protein n=1 Tax=Acuticoccus mangrovi TaxID=2796142 RepID=A0A934MHS5_9HYPH|nr:hypothetical protein [Acuticoccus mangrovi]MBJ3777988.1 hypothetical protein [Acuticoccus mangrovi]